MEQFTPSNGPERKQTLYKIREYVLSLLKKKKEIERENEIDTKRQDIQDTITSTSKKNMEIKKKKKSLFHRLKEKFTGSTDEQESGGTMSKGGFELPQEDRDEYIPRDSEFGEAMGESPRFGEIYPPFLGYFTQGKKSYFDARTNLRSKKKQLSSLDHSLLNGVKKYQYAGQVTSGVTAIPLPEGVLPDTNSLCFHGSQQPTFWIDQNNCIYIKSLGKQFVSFDFAFGQTENKTPPISEDSENIVFGQLSTDTEQLLSRIGGMNPQSQAQAIRSYINSTRKYNIDRQGTLRNTSNGSNYLTNLDASPVLEFYSANTLFVGLCRKLGIPARLIVGHMVQSVAKGGKAHVSSNNGHAWSEIWDDAKQERVRFDATPKQKEDGSDTNQNHDQSDQNNQQNNNADSNMDNQDQQGGDQSGDPSGNSSSQDQSGSQQLGGGNEQGNHPEKSASEMLDELIEKAKEDSLIRQAKDIKKILDQLENASSKEEIRDTLDNAGLEDFSKDLVDKVGNDGILEEEKKEIESLDDEKEIDKSLQDSLLDQEYKNKLQRYANTIKERIAEQKRKMKSEMERFGFEDHELHLYKQYKELEKEVQPQVRQQINELQKLLPPKRQILRDEQNYYRSGAKLDRSKLVDWKVSGNNKIFQRTSREMDTREINMFETILIDRSGSMGTFDNNGSPLREAVKTAIIRAKVLEHFKVNFSIQFFDDSTEEIMSFGEKFSDRKRCLIPSRLMKAVQKSGGTNIGEPLTYTFLNMKDFARQNGNESFGNITFLGDGKPHSGIMGQPLKNLIKQIRNNGFGLTAYYINGSGQNMNELQQYFGSTDSGGTVLVSDVNNLTKQVISSYNKSLRKIVARYTK